MSLLFQISNEKVNHIARQVCDKHFEIDPKLHSEYDERRKRLMYEDVLYNIAFLNTAMEFNDDKIFIDYAVWLYQLLCHLMKDLNRDRIKDQMVLHYKILENILTQTLSEEEANKARHHLNNAIVATEYEALHFDEAGRFTSAKYNDIKEEYQNHLIKYDTRGAIQVVERAENSGIKVDDIYVEILQEVMHEVGNLWHKNVITVDKEHYCTAATQQALTQFYPAIFNTPRNGCKILACAVGSELHDMGIRMVADLFEYRGWDSIFLGAAVPKEAILNSITENKPDLVALSVSMPPHLSQCHEIVNAIRKKHKDIKIAVGGPAFKTTNELWKKWEVDISTDNAAQLAEWADKNIVNIGDKSGG